MKQKECIAMILAGGKGVRLGSLTDNTPKPAVHFGGKYRIIDFTLSNCRHSGIDTLGVLTQYHPRELHAYISNGRAWELDRIDGGVSLLPSYRSKNGVHYSGTADAVYQNIEFIEQFNPEYVLILSGDHIYKMDYRKMLDFHKQTNADATISVIPVPIEEASRFGIMSTAADGLITEFAEKPKIPKSNLASMGVYIFKWSQLKKYLIADNYNIRSENDFGKNIIPAMLAANKNLYAYKFYNYWKDVGTVQSFWEANMDLIQDYPKIDLRDNSWKILTKFQHRPSCCISGEVEIRKSIIAEGCKVRGKIDSSVLFDSVSVGEGAEVVDSILMPGVTINKNAKIYKAIIGTNVLIGENAEIGADCGINTFYDAKICSKDISLVGPGIYVGENIKIEKNSHIYKKLLQNRQSLPINRNMTELEVIYV